MVYENSRCWQSHVREKNFQEGIKELNLADFRIEELRIRDFEFRFIAKEDQKMCLRIKEFIERHEWLGKMPNRPTHRFIATINGVIAGVIVMATPNAMSHILGKENKNLEKLISRGACISWSPKNLASWLIKESIDWMVQNTKFRVFSGYSDPTAGELGTIYQASNFIYLGNTFGTQYEFFDPNNPARGWFSDRLFRKVGQYKKYARKIGIQWDDSWNEKGRMIWDNVPPLTHARLSHEAIKYQESCEKRKPPKKHKYIYIRGRDKRETRELKEIFLKYNPKMSPKGLNSRLGIKYPKERGK
jgi:hypothetical protein